MLCFSILHIHLLPLSHNIFLLFFQVVALAFGPLVNITTKSLTIIRVADELKEVENSLKNRIIRKSKSIANKIIELFSKKKKSTSSETPSQDTNEGDELKEELTDSAKEEEKKNR